MREVIVWAAILTGVVAYTAALGYALKVFVNNHEWEDE